MKLCYLYICFDHRKTLVKKTNFFSFCQNIPFSNLIEEKIILRSSDSLYGRNYNEFEIDFFAGFNINI